MVIDISLLYSYEENLNYRIVCAVVKHVCVCAQPHPIVVELKLCQPKHSHCDSL